ncbi:hypothetical protein GX50_00189 [[Emmonsia] crescens]|uniref:Uncharacterized protein n=1 Tax=[Emmonsia] crescens TaxID=73230 RepID=A0A2B7ZKC2_9EURO|nr:hypothetical protein GX50_00189 [Emmonsia crescens]
MVMVLSRCPNLIGTSGSDQQRCCMARLELSQVPGSRLHSLRISPGSKLSTEYSTEYYGEYQDKKKRMPPTAAEQLYAGLVPLPNPSSHHSSASK